MQLYKQKGTRSRFMPRSIIDRMCLKTTRHVLQDSRTIKHREFRRRFWLLGPHNATTVIFLFCEHFITWTLEFPNCFVLFVLLMCFVLFVVSKSLMVYECERYFDSPRLHHQLEHQLIKTFKPTSNSGEQNILRGSAWCCNYIASHSTSICVSIHMYESLQRKLLINPKNSCRN